MISTKNDAKKWKFIIIRDDNGNEIQRIELNDKQKQTTLRTRNKRRKFDRPKVTKPKAAKKKILQPQVPKLRFDIQHTVIYSRDAIKVEQNYIDDDPFLGLFDELPSTNLNENRCVSEISFNDFTIEDCYSNEFGSNFNGQVQFYFMNDRDLNNE